MKFIILLIALSLNTFAQTLGTEVPKECLNKIPQSQAIKAIALEPNAGSKTCSDLPEEPCLCFDEVVWEAAEIVDGKLKNNAEKMKAHKAKQDEKKAQADTKAAARAALKKTDFSTITTIKALKEVVQQLIEQDL